MAALPCRKRLCDSFQLNPATPGGPDLDISAWYIFAASGFYPLAGTDQYVLGSPIFTRVTMHLPGGDLVVDAKDTSPRARFVNAVDWAGNKLSAARITHPDIARGGTLTFTMRDTP